jgi:hypothetical protein
MEKKADCCTIFDLDSTELALLEYYANNSTGKAGSMARGILEYGYGYHFNCCLPENNPSTLKRTAFNNSAVGNGLQVSATPNPASTWVAFDYKLPPYAGEAILQVLDIKGNCVTTFTLTSKQGQQVWDVRDIQKGAYLYVLRVGNLRKSGKLIVE